MNITEPTRPTIRSLRIDCCRTETIIKAEAAYPITHTPFGCPKDHSPSCSDNGEQRLLRACAGGPECVRKEVGSRRGSTISRSHRLRKKPSSGTWGGRSRNQRYSLEARLSSSPHFALPFTHTHRRPATDQSPARAISGTPNSPRSGASWSSVTSRRAVLSPSSCPGRDSANVPPWPGRDRTSSSPLLVAPPRVW